MRKKFDSIQEEILFHFYSKIAQENTIVDKAKGCIRDKDASAFKTSLNVLNTRLKNGWTPEQIMNRLYEAHQWKIKTYRLGDIIPMYPPTTNDKEDRNLILPGVKYKHPELKIINMPLYDEEGILINEGEVTRKEIFTLGDLIQYYYDKLKPQEVLRKDVANLLKRFLADGYSLDHILRAIDLWSIQSSQTSRGNDPWELVRTYIPQAIEEESALDD